MRLNWCGGVPLFLQFLDVFNERLLMHQPGIMPVSQNTNVSQPELDEALIHKVHGRVDV